MQKILLLIAICAYTTSHAQIDARISTIDFVQILNGNKDEALFYYQNNWKILRDMAKENGYIYSFQLLETQKSEDAPFHLILITTYPNTEQYDLREEHFSELIEKKGDLRLLNNKQPGEFRKTLFSKEKVKHLE